MLISSITKKNEDSYSLLFDNGCSCSVSLSEISQFHIFTGKEIEEEELRNIVESADISNAKKISLNALSVRQFSKKELKDKLRRKGISEKAADAAVEWVTGLGMINEELYAAGVASHYYAKGFGTGKVKAEFTKRGIEKEFWSEALENCSENEEKARKLIASKLKDPNDRNEIRKVSSALYRRGFSTGFIRKVMSEYIQDYETGD